MRVSLLFCVSVATFYSGMVHAGVILNEVSPVPDARNPLWDDDKRPRLDRVATNADNHSD